MTDPIAHQRPVWPRWTFRVVATAAAILLFVQSVTAGMFIPDHDAHAAFDAHRVMALVAGGAVLLLLVAAILLAAVGGGGALPIVASTVLLVLVLAEMAVGSMKIVPLHVPLGVGIIALGTVTAVVSWLRPRRSPEGGAAALAQR
jgi:hypothetical protein